MRKEIIRTDKAPAPIGPYNQAVRTGNLMFVSGQVAIDPETGALNNADIGIETQQVMKNLEAILKEAGTDFNNIIKVSIFLSDMALFKQVNEIYGSYFSEDTAPARETVAVKGLPKNVNVEISAIVAL